MANINDLIYTIKFSSQNLTYSTDSSASLWNGVNHIGSISNYFTTKNDFNTSWGNDFIKNIELWDTYSNLSLSEANTGETANIHGYGAEATANAGAGATTWFDKHDTGTEYEGVDFNQQYERSEFFFNNNSMTEYDEVGARDYILLHELSHSFGLRGDTLIDISYTTDMTVASYNIPDSGYEKNALGIYDFNDLSNSRFAVTPMAYDIAAMELLYGHVDTSTSNDRYSFNREDFTGEKRSITIKDDGGQDKFDFSDYTGTGLKVNLGQAIDGNDTWLNNKTIVGEEYVYLARGTVIEDVTGSAQSDEIIGNEVDNHIRSGGGDDTIYGEAGNDKLHGGSGNDTLHGGEGDDRLSGSTGHDQLHGDAGNDKLYGGMGSDTLHGGEDDDRLSGSSGHDQLHGDTGNDKLYGGSGNDILHGGEDDDRLSGSSGHDQLHGDTGNDKLYGGTGSDILNGGSGNDRLSGSTGHDMLIGGEGDDKLYGGSGDDTLSGGEGNDMLRGGNGADVFDFSQNDGGNIMDFQLGEDKIHLSDYNLSHSEQYTSLSPWEFSDLSITEAKGNSYVSIGDSDAVIYVKNTSGLSESDFSFEDWIVYSS